MNVLNGSRLYTFSWKRFINIKHKKKNRECPKSSVLNFYIYIGFSLFKFYRTKFPTILHFYYTNLTKKLEHINNKELYSTLEHSSEPPYMHLRCTTWLGPHVVLSGRTLIFSIANEYINLSISPGEWSHSIRGSRAVLGTLHTMTYDGVLTRLVYYIMVITTLTTTISIDGYNETKSRFESKKIPNQTAKTFPFVRYPCCTG